MKSSTIEQYLTFYPDSPLPHMNPDQKTKIKFEIDTDPPAGARTETRLLNFPAMKKISLYSPDSLFAGKIHAILCRSWKNRTKGRDLYDFQFYLQNDIPVNLENLRFKLIQSGYVSPDETISLDWLKTELSRRFRTINYDQAIRDVRPFLQPESYQQISQWGAELFELMCQKLKAAV